MIMTTSQDQTDLRATLGAFATGVTVVTTQTADGPLGMTVNSFASVSLDPPLILWSPARKSARFPAFERAEHFAVHVLSEAQVPLAQAFAADGWAPFDDYAFEPGIGGAPLLAGCCARLQCRHAAGHDGGDHLIVVGEVLAHETSDAPPLIFHRGTWATLRAGG
jgi:3-hydroxy-9,10-secoandrosta-1,3,5(10)-triene-9,17-dione monooxygenase reductase component